MANHFLKSLGLEDDAPEQVPMEENQAEEPQEAQDKKVPGTGAIAPGSASINVDDVKNDNTPKMDITTGVDGGDVEGGDDERVNENNIEDPDYVDPEQQDNEEVADDTEVTEEVVEGDGDTEVVDTNEAGAGDEIAEGDETEEVEVTEGTVIEDVEPEPVADVSEDEEDEADEDLEDLDEEAEEEEESEEEAEEAEEELEDLKEANEAWTLIMRSAVKNNNVTPELKAGLETHFNRLEAVLGDHVRSELSSLEAFQDDDALYSSQAVASLEGVGDTLERIGERITNRLSQAFNVVGDLITQKKTYGKLQALADAALNKIADTKETSRELKTGLQTRALTSRGILPKNIAASVTTHTKAIEDVFNNFIPKVTGNLSQLLAVANSATLKKTDSLTAAIAEVRKVPLPSSYLKPEWKDGKCFLGNIAFTGGEGHPVVNGSFARYIRSRAAAGRPMWIDLDDVPQRTKLTVKKADAVAALKAIRQHCANMENAHSKIRQLETNVSKQISHVLASMHRYNPEVRAAALVSRPLRYQALTSQAALQEVALFDKPSRRAIYNDVRVMRGVIKFLSQY